MADESPKIWDMGECPHPDCEKAIAPSSFCCLTHWKALGVAGRKRFKKCDGREAEALRIAGEHWFPDE